MSLHPPLVTPLQTGPNIAVDLQPFEQLLGSAIGAFLTTLVVGAILIAIVPDYTETKMASLLDDPVGSFLYGLVVFVFLALVVVVLVLSILGILVAIPLLLVSYLVWAVGASIAYLAIGDRLVGRDGGWTTPLLVGAGINGALTLTGVGGILTFCIGAAGFGAVLRDYLG